MPSTRGLGARSPIGLRFIRPIIETLQKTPGNKLHKDDLKNAIVKDYEIPAREAGHEMMSGRNEILHDMGWARSSLVKAGLLRRPHETKKGVWELTSLGIKTQMDDTAAEHLYRTNKPYR